MLKEELLRLSRARDGHFSFESGHHGRLWLDLDLLVSDPAPLAAACRDLADQLRPDRPDLVCGPMIGGGLLAYRVAEELGCAFAYAERGSDASYRIPDSMLRRCAGRRVAIVDDVMNAGSALTATYRELIGQAAEVSSCAALMVLGDTPGRLTAGFGIPLRVLARIPNQLWLPPACPDCAAGVALDVR